MRGREEAYSFNPCEGFGGFGTTPDSPVRSSIPVAKKLTVSIPVRDLVVLEPVGAEWLAPRQLVSIPVRDLVVLEPRSHRMPGGESAVSIPVRDLVVLEP